MNTKLKELHEYVKGREENEQEKRKAKDEAEPGDTGPAFAYARAFGELLAATEMLALAELHILPQLEDANMLRGLLAAARSNTREGEAPR